MKLKGDSENVEKQLEELRGLYSELLSSNPQPGNSSKDMTETSVEYQPVGDDSRRESETKPGLEHGDGDGSSSVTKPGSGDDSRKVTNREPLVAWGPNDPNDPQQTGGRKTRHRGKSRKNKKTRKNKKQKKTTKK